MLQSPLRYPGGKAKLFERVASIIVTNKLFKSEYVEPYAGGAGLALRLLSSGFVDRIWLNDSDPAVFSFWSAALERPEEFCALIDAATLNVEEWKRQRAIQQDGSATVLDLGFSTFYLNRTNRSGIVSGAGPIGGYDQSGRWQIDARFNKSALVDAVMFLRSYRNQITLSNLDAADLISSKIKEEGVFMYLDPPYFVKGHRLYRNHYTPGDHEVVANLLRKNRGASWIVSYDDVPEIRRIYHDFRFVAYDLKYSAAKAASGAEVMFFSDAVV